MARILLGVSGGIAAYKSLELVRLATAAGHALRVVQTPASRRFVGAASFAALTGAPVLCSEFERDPARGAFPDQSPPDHEPLSHLELVARADVYLIAPASANTIAKLACGMSENLLTSCALAAACPLVVAPAMNNRMYEHPAVQANLELLRERGAHVVEPTAGRLASRGEEGIGRLAEPAELLAACEAVLAGGGVPGTRKSSPGALKSAPDALKSAPGLPAWRGLRVLVTAGGTREPIDSVRFIGNSSSGRMGIALAHAAHGRGADVTLLAANVSLPIPAGIDCRRVVTAAELQQACEEEFASCDVLLMAAAVADFRPAAPRIDKIKKSRARPKSLELEPTADVLAGLAARRRDGQTIVGFAAEHGEAAVARAREKLEAKRLDAIVVNDISRADIGFDADDNEVTIVFADGQAPRAGAPTHRGDRAGADGVHVARAPKSHVAEAVLDAVERLRGGGRGAGGEADGHSDGPAGAGMGGG